MRSAAHSACRAPVSTRARWLCLPGLLRVRRGEHPAEESRIERGRWLFTLASATEGKRVSEARDNADSERRTMANMEKGSRRKRVALFNRKKHVPNSWERA